MQTTESINFMSQGVWVFCAYAALPDTHPVSPTIILLVLTIKCFILAGLS